MLGLKDTPEWRQTNWISGGFAVFYFLWFGFGMMEPVEASAVGYWFATTFGSEYVPRLRMALTREAWMIFGNPCFWAGVYWGFVGSGYRRILYGLLPSTMLLLFIAGSSFILIWLTPLDTILISLIVCTIPYTPIGTALGFLISKGSRFYRGRGAAIGLALSFLFIGRADSFELSGHRHFANRGREILLLKHATEFLEIEEYSGAFETGAQNEDGAIQGVGGGLVYTCDAVSPICQARVLRHFYNPVTTQGLGLTPTLSFQSSRERAVVTWNSALAAYRNGDKGGAYELLGRVAHLVAGDHFQPAHVHNDPHGPYPVFDSQVLEAVYDTALESGANPGDSQALGLKSPFGDKKLTASRLRGFADDTALLTYNRSAFSGNLQDLTFPTIEGADVGEINLPGGAGPVDILTTIHQGLTRLKLDTAASVLSKPGTHGDDIFSIADQDFWELPENEEQALGGGQWFYVDRYERIPIGGRFLTDYFIESLVPEAISHTAGLLRAGMRAFDPKEPGIIIRDSAGDRVFEGSTTEEEVLQFEAKDPVDDVDTVASGIYFVQVKNLDTGETIPQGSISITEQPFQGKDEVSGTFTFKEDGLHEIRVFDGTGNIGKFLVKFKRKPSPPRVVAGRDTFIGSRSTLVGRGLATQTSFTAEDSDDGLVHFSISGEGSFSQDFDPPTFNQVSHTFSETAPGTYNFVAINVHGEETRGSVELGALDVRIATAASRAKFSAAGGGENFVVDLAFTVNSVRPLKRFIVDVHHSFPESIQRITRDIGGTNATVAITDEIVLRADSLEQGPSTTGPGASFQYAAIDEDGNSLAFTQSIYVELNRIQKVPGDHFFGIPPERPVTAGNSAFAMPGDLVVADVVTYKERGAGIVGSEGEISGIFSIGDFQPVGSLSRFITGGSQQQLIWQGSAHIEVRRPCDWPFGDGCSTTVVSESAERLLVVPANTNLSLTDQLINPIPGQVVIDTCVEATDQTTCIKARDYKIQTAPLEMVIGGVVLTGQFADGSITIPETIPESEDPVSLGFPSGALVEFPAGASAVVPHETVGFASAPSGFLDVFGGGLSYTGDINPPSGTTISFPLTSGNLGGRPSSSIRVFLVDPEIGAEDVTVGVSPDGTRVTARLESYSSVKRFVIAAPTFPFEATAGPIIAGSPEVTVASVLELSITDVTSFPGEVSQELARLQNQEGFFATGSKFLFQSSSTINLPSELRWRYSDSAVTAGLLAEEILGIFLISPTGQSFQLETSVNLASHEALSEIGGADPTEGFLFLLGKRDGSAPNTYFSVNGSSELPTEFVPSDSFGFIVDDEAGASFSSGISELKVSIDGGPFLRSTGPVSLQAGPRSISFFSVDNFGNAEPVRSENIVVERTDNPPANLRPFVVGDSNIGLEWDSNGNPVRGTEYTLLFLRLSSGSCSLDEPLENFESLQVEQPGFVFDRLLSESVYLFSVCRNEGGGGGCASTIAVKTLASGDEPNLNPEPFVCGGEEGPATGQAIAVDGANSIWAVIAPDGADGVALAKFDADGGELFSVALSSGTSSAGWGIGFDAANAAYAAGSAELEITPGEFSDAIAVYKVTAAKDSGAPLATSIPGFAQGAYISADGKSVWITGSSEGPGDTEELGLWRFDIPSGILQKTGSYARGTSLDRGQAVSVAPDGSVWVAGKSRSGAHPGGANIDLALWRFSSDGTALTGGPFFVNEWLAEEVVDGDIELPSLALGIASGGVFIADQKANPEGNADLAVFVFSLDGTLSRQDYWHSEDSADESVGGIGIDPSGNVHIAGASNRIDGPRVAVWTYSPHGDFLSAKTVADVDQEATDIVFQGAVPWLALSNSTAPYRFENAVDLLGARGLQGVDEVPPVSFAALTEGGIVDGSPPIVGSGKTLVFSGRDPPPGTGVSQTQARVVPDPFQPLPETILFSDSFNEPSRQGTDGSDQWAVTGDWVVTGGRMVHVPGPTGTEQGTAVQPALPENQVSSDFEVRLKVKLPSGSEDKSMFVRLAGGDPTVAIGLSRGADETGVASLYDEGIGGDPINVILNPGQLARLNSANGIAMRVQSLGRRTRLLLDDEVVIDHELASQFTGTGLIFAGISGAGEGPSFDDFAIVRPGSLALLGDGLKTIEYYSTDGAGNAETVKSMQVGVDATPPQTARTSAPLYADAHGREFIGLGATPAFTATDPQVGGVASGVRETVVQRDRPILFQDSFDEAGRTDPADKWDVTGPWTIQGGELQLTGTGTPGTVGRASPKGVEVVDFEMSAEFRLQMGQARSDIMVWEFRRSSAAAPGALNGNVVFTFEAQEGFPVMFLREDTLDGSGNPIRRALANAPVPAETFAKLEDFSGNIPLRLLADGGHFEVELDGNLLIDYDDPNVLDRSPLSLVVITAESGTAFALDNVEVRGARPAGTTADREGANAFAYHSVDNVGNVEAAKGLTVYVDTTPPVAQVAVTGTPLDLNGTAVYPGAVSATLTLADVAGGGPASGLKIATATQVLFEDSFDEAHRQGTEPGAFWITQGPWTINGGKLILGPTGDAVGTAEMRGIEAIDFDLAMDVAIPFSASPLTDRLVLNMRRAFDASGGSQVTFLAIGSSPEVNASLRRQVFDADGNLVGISVLANGPIPPDIAARFAAGEEVHMEASAHGDAYRVVIDGFEVLQATDPNPPESGSVRIAARVQAVGLSVDNVRLTRPVDPADTLAFAGEGVRGVDIAAEDNVGNKTTIQERFILDALGPKLTYSGSAGGTRFVRGGKDLSVAFSALDGVDPSPQVQGELVRVATGFIDTPHPSEGPIAVAGGETFATEDLAGGLWELRLTAQDFIGNVSSSTVGPFEIRHDLFNKDSNETLNGEPVLNVVSTDGDLDVQYVDTGTPAGAIAVQSSFDSGLEVGGNIYELQQSTSFAEPALVILRFDPAVIQDTSTLAIYRFDGVAWSSSGVMDQMVYFEPDPRIEGYIVATSLYAVFWARPDVTPPVTQLAFTGPRIEQDGLPLVSTATLLGFDAADVEVEGDYTSGVAATHYRLDASTSDAFVVFTGSFTAVEGEHSIEFFSVDRRDNVEAVSSATVRVDGTAPETQIEFADATLSVLGQAIVTGDAEVAFLTEDPGGIAAGVARTELSIDGGPYQTVVGTTSLPSGARTIAYRSVDRVENVEEAKTLSTAVFPFLDYVFLTPGKVKITGKASVQGGYLESAPAAPFDLEAALAAVETDNNNAALGEHLVDGVLTLSGKDVLSVPAGAYLVSGIEVSGQAELSAGGDVVFYVRGPVSVSAQAVVNAAATTQLILLSDSSADITVTGKAFFGGLIYAPLADAKFAGQAVVRAHVYAANIQASGGAFTGAEAPDTGALVAQAVVGKGGGKAFKKGKGGVKLPPGALKSQKKITVEDADAPAAPGLTRAGAALQFGPQGTRFDEPVTLLFDFDPDALPEGVDPRDLAVHYWNPETEAWELLPSTVTLASSQVEAETTHFSLYALFAPEPENDAAGAASPAVTPSIDAAFRLGEVYVYPSPALGGQAQTLHVETGVADRVSVQIFDVAGREVHASASAGFPDIVGVASSARYAYQMPVPGKLASGVYLYVVITEKGGERLVHKGKFAVLK